MRKKFWVDRGWQHNEQHVDNNMGNDLPSFPFINYQPEFGNSTANLRFIKMLRYWIGVEIFLEIK
ncbi:MAG: hypothetical protein ACUZ8O_14125, partial [Candidatus Anammoxibacter sp.]